MTYLLISKAQVPDWRGHLNAVGADGKSLYHGWGVLREFPNHVLVKTRNPALITWAATNTAAAETLPRLFQSAARMTPRLAALAGTVAAGSTVGDVLVDMVGVEHLE